MENTTKLQNHRGRFVSIAVKRAKSGTTVYCGKIKRITPKTLQFFSINDGNKLVTVPLANVISAS